MTMLYNNTYNQNYIIWKNIKGAKIIILKRQKLLIKFILWSLQEIL